MAGSKKEYSLGFIIGAQLKSSFPAAFKNVEKQILSAQKAVKNCGAAWKDFGAKAGKLVLGVTGAAAGAATAIWKMTDSIADSGDRAAKNAAKLKMSTEGFQELEYAFNAAGLGGDEFSGIMTKLDATLVKAATNEKTAAAWAEEYGLSAEKLARMSPEKRIERLADYLNELKDPLEKDRLALELFGKSGAEMSAILEMGSSGIQSLRKEARDTGNVMSAAAARQAEAYSDMKQRMTSTFSGIKTQLLSGLFPVFTQIFGGISDKLQSVNWSEWGTKITGWVKGAIPKVKEIATSIGDFIGRIWSGIQAVKDFVGGWGNLAKIGAFAAMLPTIISGVQALVSTFKMFKAGIAVVTKLFPILGSGGLAALGPLLPIIAAVAAAAFIIYKNWDKIRPLFEQVMASLKGAWDKVWPSIQGAIAKLEPLIQKIGDAIAGLIQFMMPMFQWGIEYIGVIIENVMNLIGPLFDYISSLLTFFIDLFTGNWSKLGEDIKAIWEAIKGFVGAALEGIKNIISKWVEGVLTIFAPLTNFFNGIGEKIASIFGGKKTMTVDVQTTGSVASHASGGIFNRPHLTTFAENAPRVPEAAIPVENTPRSRGLWDQVGRMAGFTQNANTSNERFDVPVSVSVSVSGNADANTARMLKSAANDISSQVRAAVRAELGEIARQKARLAL